ncbi:UDP-N-acetylglucosamine 2-epimerase [Halorientalis halophila]|uniref:UDP-N-acetylglucosamine 2-epimerase n=1 Tax=Halorientalis halophila TaxID=3108499 RepID=UPI00300AE2A9
MTRNIVVCLTSRGNYARIGTVLHELEADPEIDLDIVVAGASMLRKYGTLSEILREDGLEISQELYNVIEGGNPVSSAKTTGLGIVEFTNVLSNIDPDGVVTIADRYETMAITLSASYLNIPVLHTQGGEITGSIDERVRHATTKFADYHFVSTERSAEIVNRLGEYEERIFNTGCPSMDLAAEIQDIGDSMYDPQDQYGGVGSDVDVTDDYLVVQYHPVVTEYESEYDKTWELINAIDELEVQAFWFWPNMDAGTDQVSKAIREYRNIRDPDDVRFFINLRPRDYLTLVNNSACLVGNSSVGIRECSFLGQPSVNIGDRQKHRERAENVTDVDCETDAIREAVREQIAVDEYSSSSLYGTGDAGEKICKRIKEIDLEMKGSMDPNLLGVSEPALPYQ